MPLIKIDNQISYDELTKCESSINITIKKLEYLQNYLGIKSVSKTLADLEKLEDAIYDSRKKYDEKRFKTLTK